MFTHIVEGDPEFPLAPHKHTLTAEARACEVEYAEYLDGAYEARAEAAAEERYERWLEDGGAAGPRIAWENEQDRLREDSLR